MTDPREMLSNHLTAHGVPLEIGIRSTDIEDILRSMDYAMVLGMIPARSAALLLAKYCDDELEERKCRSWWLATCVEYASAKGWRRPKARMVEGLAYATMDEHMGHGTRCAVCHGTKAREVDRKVIECPACGGRGFVEYLAEQYADRIGCTLPDYARTWVPRVDWARRALLRWEIDAAEALKARLADY